MDRLVKYGVVYPILVIIGLFILMIGIAYINHKIRLEQEEQFIPQVEMFEVNNHEMHVYTEGVGEKTFVFLAGGGTSSPLLDFKVLYQLFSDDNQIVVVEKAGYGFSDITESNRDIETILSETREALKKAEVEGPYILVPHSMSGIEALYWAQNYPMEVEAIIGLDMAVPEAYEEMNIPMTGVRLGEFIARTGLIRWLPLLPSSDIMQNEALTKEELELYEVLFYRRTSTKNMINEIKEVKGNAVTVAQGNEPQVPMLLFVSNGEDTGFEPKSWIRMQKDFVQRENREVIELDAPHYIHHYEFERIAHEAKDFVEQVIK